MGSVTALKKQTPDGVQVDPLREELRAAIGARKAITVNADKLVSAIERAKSTLAEIEGQAEKAEAAIAEARRHDADSIAAATMRGKELKSTSATRAARAVLEDLKDQAETQRLVVGQLEQELASLNEQRAWVQTRILTARNWLLAPVVEKLSEQIVAAHKTMVTAGAVLATLTEEDELPEGLSTVDRVKAANQISEPLRHERFWAANREADFETRTAAAEKVRQLMQLLLDDPDTVIDI